MLGANVKSREVDLKQEPGQEDTAKSFGKGESKGMASKRGKPGGPQAGPRAELRVFRAGSTEGRLPVSSNLRKQKSLTNLSFLTDTEKKMHLYEPKWCDDMSKPANTYLKGGMKSKEGTGQANLSRNLSKSEHSLFQGKGSPKPFSPLAAPSNLGKPSRIPRGPYAEVKPISKEPDGAEDSKSDDEILSSKAKAKKAAMPVTPSAKGQASEDNKPYLKVDPELVVTVLGDLEQLLFSQMLDPESQRKRTVQNVLDLRQNLEVTMSSLRGSQLSHSCLENTVCYDSDDANPRSVSSLSNRSSPLSWRYGQSSPRLQAGDAPSSAGGYHGQGAQYAAHTMPMRSSSRLSHISRIELIESLDSDDTDLKSGYMSDSDLLGKSLPDDEDDDLTNGWDESSSISSGLSDASDNLSSEEFNASSSLNSLPTTPIGSRRNSAIVLRTDAEKRSLVESGLSWYSESEAKGHRNTESGSYDTGSLKSDSSGRWRKVQSETTEESCKTELKKPQSLGPPNALKKGKNPPVGVTSPITHTSHSALKVAGVKGDSKAVDKAKLTVKATSLQRSCSDAGKDRGESRKPPSGISRPSAGGSFGYKKQPQATGTATVMTAGGTAISSGSATVGKTTKISGIPVKPLGGTSGGSTSGGRKTSLDVSNCAEGFLSPTARTNIQYRSLPRPAKSSTMSLTGRGSNRPVSSSIDASLLSFKPSTGSPRMKELGTSKSSGRASLGPVNQTDREKEKAKAKAVASDSECGPLKSTATTPEPSPKVQGLRPPTGTKFSELSSPISHRVLTSKSLGKPPTLAHLDKVNSNSLDSGMSNQEQPSVGPVFNKLQDIQATTSTCLTPSPAPVLNVNSNSCFSSQGISLGTSPLMYPKLSGLHRSMESLPLQMSMPSAAGYPSAEPNIKDEAQNTSSWNSSARASVGDSLCSSEEESKERRHSHAIGVVPEAECPPQLSSPSSVSLSSTGKAPFTNVVSPTGTTTPRMTRSNSIPTHDAAFELYGGSQMGSTLSLADRSKGMIRSGSFRDPADDVHGSVLSLASSASSNYSSANLVAAFEQSLVNMTSRLQSLSASAEQKDSELNDLRETIEILKAKNLEAQAVIQGALNNPDTTPKELRIKRQNSSDSISSLNSITSHSSIGSCKDADAKKKKKKSWLRSSFNKAFSIKKGPKSASSYSDIEEIATPDSSAPSSPKLTHEGNDINPPLKPPLSPASSVIPEVKEEPENEEKVVSELRSELWEKEMKLTDIRLEALNSAHQLEQLQEAMNNMQEVKQQEFFIGCVKFSSKSDWSFLDSLVCQDYIKKVDPSSTLGLSSDSIYSYSINHGRRVLGADVPEMMPYRCMGKGTSFVAVVLKGLKEKCVDSLVFETLIPKPMMQHYISLLLKHRRLVLSGPSGTGKTYLTTRLAEYLVERSGRDITEGIAVTYNMHKQSCKDLQLYLSNLANQIDRETSTGEVPLVVILDDLNDAGSISELVNGALTCKYHKCPYIIGTTNQPVKMTPNHGLHLSFRMVTFSNNVEPANGFLVRYLHRKLIEAENESTVNNQDLLQVLDWVPKLWYHLHAFLEKHSTSDFLIGPCFFLSCPVTVEEFRTWFIDLWNHSIIPYLQEGAKDGIKVHGQKNAWEDPVEWVRGTLPWPSAQQDQAKLFHLPPPSVVAAGPSVSTGQQSEERNPKETTPSSLESDPLLPTTIQSSSPTKLAIPPAEDREGREEWSELNVTTTAVPTTLRGT
ncbi:NAV1 protein, partial [Polypterus senegalus]